MADKRIYELPDATTWDGYIPQDKSGGTTQRVSVAQVETRLIADGFAKTDQIPAASSIAPADLAASAGVGASNAFARADHAHKKPGASDIGAEPALSDPGPGTWYLRSIGAIRSWVASIPWASVDKTGAVATDVGALPEIVVTGSVNFNSINSGLPCSAEISPSSVSNGPTGYTSPTRSHLLQSRGAANYLTQVLTTATAAAFRGMTSPGVWGAWRYAWDDAYLPISAFAMTLLDDASATAARSTLGVLPIANPTATGTLTAPAVVVSGLAGSGSRTAGINSSGQIVESMYTAKDCLNITTTAPTSAPNYIRANSYTGGIGESASYRGSLKGHIDAGSVLDVRFTIGGVQSSAGNQLTSEQTGDFVLQWWLETYASGQDAILNFQMATWPGATFKQFGLMHTFPAPTLGGSDDLKIELKIGNTSVAVRTMSEILERIA